MAVLASSASLLLGSGAALSAEETRFFDAVEQGQRALIPGGTLPARWLSWLLTDRAASAAVGVGGIHIVGAAGTPVQITGDVHAPHAKVPFPVVFECCHFDGRVDLSMADLPLLTFEGCATQAIDLRGSALGMLRFRLGSTCTGGMTLTVARIERAADFTGATLTATSGPALSADWLRVNGPLNFHSKTQSALRFRTVGGVRLYGARIGGEVNLRHAILDDEREGALNADQIVVEGTLALDHAEISGTIRFVGADIKGDLVAEGVQLQAGPEDSARGIRLALIADHARIGGSLYLRKGFHATGQVRLYGASIERDLECHGAQFENGDAVALNAQSVRIEGDLQFADIESPLLCRIDGHVDLRRAVIKGALVWRAVEARANLRLNLESARASTLADQPECWPLPDRLDLHNFEYDSIANDSPMDAISRVDWLRRSRGFSHQAYDHLATVLRRQGRFADAREVLYAKEHRYANEARLTPGDRWWYGFGTRRVRLGFGPLAGYGYRLKWAFIVLLATVMGCGGVYMAGYPSLISPTSDRPPAFQSWAYSLDVFVPIVDLSQGGAWIPDPNRGTLIVRGPRGDLRTGGLLLGLYWLEIAIGWSVSSVLAGTVTARLARD